MAADDFDPEIVGGALVKVAQKLMRDHPHIGQILLECTDMPPYAEAVCDVTGVEVFDPVDMVKRVNAMVG